MSMLLLLSVFALASLDDRSGVLLWRSPGGWVVIDEYEAAVYVRFQDRPDVSFPLALPAALAVIMPGYWIISRIRRRRSRRNKEAADAAKIDTDAMKGTHD